MNVAISNRTETEGTLAEQCSRLKGNFLGIELSIITRVQLLELFRQSLRTHARLTISFLNPNYAVYARRNPEIIVAMNSFDILLPDATGVVQGARFLGLPVPEKLGNDDIGEDLFTICSEQGYSNFLFGSRPGVAERAAFNLQRSFPELKVAGTLHGLWFDLGSKDASCGTSIGNDEILQRINTSGADVLCVGLSTPLQQFWVYNNRTRIQATVVMTCGGYLDHLAERVHWYPPLFYKSGLTWFYRLLREPRRMWKRYSIEMLIFAGLLMRAKIARLRIRSVP